MAGTRSGQRMVRLTIREIAARAGVSTATVSNVMNLKGKMSRSTRRRVRGVIKSIGWSPNFHAARLAKRTGVSKLNS